MPATSFPGRNRSSHNKSGMEPALKLGCKTARLAVRTHAMSAEMTIRCQLTALFILGIVRQQSTVVNRWDEKAGLRTGCGVRSQVIDVLKAQIKRRPAMKKVSIVAVKRSRNFSQPKLTIG